MLKIKDNIDLKELEKFGFRYIHDYPTHYDYYQVCRLCKKLFLGESNEND